MAFSGILFQTRSLLFSSKVTAPCPTSFTVWKPGSCQSVFSRWSIRPGMGRTPAVGPLPGSRPPACPGPFWAHHPCLCGGCLDRRVCVCARVGGGIEMRVVGLSAHARPCVRCHSTGGLGIGKGVLLTAKGTLDSWGREGKEGEVQVVKPKVGPDTSLSAPSSPQSPLTTPPHQGRPLPSQTQVPITRVIYRFPSSGTVVTFQTRSSRVGVPGPLSWGRAQEGVCVLGGKCGDNSRTGNSHLSHKSPNGWNFPEGKLGMEVGQAKGGRIQRLSLCLRPVLSSPTPFDHQLFPSVSLSVCLTRSTPPPPPNPLDTGVEPGVNSLSLHGEGQARGAEPGVSESPPPPAVRPPQTLCQAALPRVVLCPPHPPQRPPGSCAVEVACDPCGQGHCLQCNQLPVTSPLPLPLLPSWTHQPNRKPPENPECWLPSSQLLLLHRQKICSTGWPQGHPFHTRDSKGTRLRPASLSGRSFQ